MAHIKSIRINTAEMSWRDHLALAEQCADLLPDTVHEGESTEPTLLHTAQAVYHLTKALAGMVAGDPQVSRWKPMEQLQPAPDSDTDSA